MGFVVNDEDTGSEEEISVSEDAKSFREEQASLPASEREVTNGTRDCLRAR